MLKKYQEEVLVAYKKLKPGLSHNLKNATPANLRDEALMLYEKRPEGAEILRVFSKQGYVKLSDNEGIGKLDIDKFKPVSRFLIDKTSNPNLRVVELVAWLIDFKPRPYEVWKERLRTDKGEGDTGGDEGGSTWFSSRIDELKKLLANFKAKRAIGALFLVSASSIIAYTILNEQCMYWTGEQYQPIGCKIKKGDTSIIALDERKITHFKRITRPDTLTKKDLGKVWYIKIDSPEFYTDSGDYPTDTRRRLRPMSDYIFKEHILKKYALRK